MTLDFLIKCGIRIFLAFIAGFVLGLERKHRHQVVGMRTLILICESSAMLSILSIFLGEFRDYGDSARIAAGLINGIGFLGAGVIMKQGLNIKGLTSAAIILTDATIGLLIGEGVYIPAFSLLIVAVVSLIWLERMEERWFPAGKTKSLNITFSESSVDITRVTSIIESYGFYVTDINLCKKVEENKTIIKYSVKTPKINDYSKIVVSLESVGALSEFSITD